MSETVQTVRLGDLAHCRSGDKGDRANIGVVANDESCYAWLVEHLTARAVAGFLEPTGIGRVVRHELPNVHALNFVIDTALAGGASRSPRIDTQGKALGTVLMELQLPAPGAIKESSRP